jgi:hypothetical protein
VAAAREQLVMTSVLDHAAGLERQDLMGLDHGREAVRDHRGGPPGRRPAARYPQFGRGDCLL